MARPVPVSLAQRGLVSVSDNVPAGMAVGNFARDFALIFREELVGKFVTGRATEAPCEGTASDATNEASGSRE